MAAEFNGVRPGGGGIRTVVFFGGGLKDRERGPRRKYGEASFVAGLNPKVVRASKGLPGVAVVRRAFHKIPANAQGLTQSRPNLFGGGRARTAVVFIGLPITVVVQAVVGVFDAARLHGPMEVVAIDFLGAVRIIFIDAIVIAIIVAIAASPLSGLLVAVGAPPVCSQAV